MLPQFQTRKMQTYLEDFDDQVVFHETDFTQKAINNQKFLENKKVINDADQMWSPNSIIDVLNSDQKGEEFARAADEFVMASGANCIFVNSLPTDQSNKENLKTRKWMIRKTIDNTLMQTMLARQAVAKKTLEIDQFKSSTSIFLRKYAKNLIADNTNVTGHKLGEPGEGQTSVSQGNFNEAKKV